MNVKHFPYPPKALSDFLRQSAWGNQPSGLYPSEGLSANVTPILEAIAAKYSLAQRNVLQTVFSEQMHGALTNAQQANINLLGNPNAFTVVTGQQIHIGLGPAYVLYKIVSAINYCNHLKVAHPNRHFVPVFWMATEDHDVEEIAYFNVNQEKYTWDTSWTTAVGDMPTSDLTGLFDWLEVHLGGGEAVKLRIQSARNLYMAPGATLASTTQHWLSELFGAFGLLVLDPRDVRLKQMAKPLFEEALQGDAMLEAFQLSTDALKKSNQIPPVHVGQSLLFWMDEQRRVRIEKNADGFHTIDGSLAWSADQMNQVVSSEDITHLSPNVLLRPLYQQAILPCVAYVGGPSEYLYWLQTPKAFALGDLVAPQLLHRKGGVILTPSQRKKLDKLQLPMMSYFEEVETLKQNIIAKELGDNELLSSIDQTQSVLESQLKILYGWKSPLLGEAKKQVDAFVKWNRKMGQSATDAFVESKFSAETWGAIAQILTSNFSLTNPQERRVFWVQYYFLYGQDWIDDLAKSVEYADHQAFFVVEP